jgi:hypothetical protein
VSNETETEADQLYDIFHPVTGRQFDYWLLRTADGSLFLNRHLWRDLFGADPDPSASPSHLREVALGLQRRFFQLRAADVERLLALATIYPELALENTTVGAYLARAIVALFPDGQIERPAPPAPPAPAPAKKARKVKHSKRQVQAEVAAWLKAQGEKA